MTVQFAVSIITIAVLTGCQPTATDQTTPNPVVTPSQTTSSQTVPAPQYKQVGAPPTEQAPQFNKTDKPVEPKVEVKVTPKVKVLSGETTRDGNVKLTTLLSNTHVLMPGDGKVHLEIKLDATKNAGGERLPMNIALVIDRSGSMRGDKMENTKAAAKHLLTQLTDRDTLAIVSYSDHVRVDLPAQLLTKEALKDATAALARIRPGGSTNLSGGLFRGHEEVSRNQRSGQVNRVILMSDGIANRGITDQKALSMQAQKNAQSGVSVSTMGVGMDYNEDLMTAVADKASGNYYFIGDSKQIASVFTQELKKMFATVAQGAVVKLLVEDGVDLDSVFGYTFTREGDEVKIPLAEMFGGQQRSILVAFRAPTVRTGMTRLAKVTLQYEDIASEGELRTAKVPLQVRVTNDKTLVEKNKNNAVEERAVEIRIATAVTEAADLFREGRAGEAEKMLEDMEASVSDSSAGMGGSARLKKRATALRGLKAEFKAAQQPNSAPAAAARAVKKAKAESYQLVK